jgi:hypothetical protein
MSDYIRGLTDALELANARPTAYAFSVASEIQGLIQGEIKRLADPKPAPELVPVRLEPYPLTDEEIEAVRRRARENFTE